jgi:hypothetical protein
VDIRMGAAPGNLPGERRGPPDCLKCVHFRITWEPAFPRRCVIFGIKCRNLPSVEIFLSTGSHCPSFAVKESFK